MLRPVHGTVTALPTFATNIAALASSSTLLAGTCSEMIDTTAFSNKPLDMVIKARIRVHASVAVTIGTLIVLYAIPEQEENASGIFPSTVTVGGATTFATKDDQSNACVRLGGAVISAVTANITYPLAFRSLAPLFGGQVPRRFCLFLTQNSGQTLHVTSSNHLVEYYSVNLENA